MIIKINVPDIGADEMEITEILVNIGDRIKAEQSIITVEGDKALTEIPTPFAGIVKEIKVSVGDKVRTGSLVMEIETDNSNQYDVSTSNNFSQLKDISLEDNNSIDIFASSALNNTKNKENKNYTYIHATPSVRKLVRQFDIDLTKVCGTGNKGRILRSDVENYIKQMVQHICKPNNTVMNFFSWPKINFNKFGTTDMVELSRIQKISGSNLHRNWIMIPHVTQFDEIDVTDLENFRQEQNTVAKQKNLKIKITLMVFIIKVVSKALEKFPKFNSSITEDNQHLILRKYINIGIAVDTKNGLLVPVLKDVNKKDIIELSNELVEISKKAREGHLTVSDMQGGCFTISNLGNIGGTIFTPIINAPEVAIIGVSKLSTKPIWNGEKFIPRMILPISLSYDHRVIDGADGARFIKFISMLMSDIRNLIM